MVSQVAPEGPLVPRVETPGIVTASPFFRALVRALVRAPRHLLLDTQEASWRNLINQLFPGAKKGCGLSPSKKKGCLACPLYRCMPVDVTDPSTGDVIKSQSVWDCVFAWQALGAWDAGRQAQGVHAAVNQAANVNATQQDRLLRLVASGGPVPSSASDTRLEPPSTPSESLPLPPEPQ